MTHYRKLKRLLAVFLIIYFVVGIGSLATSRQEIFPFYSWFLFAEVPGQVDKYALLIHAAGGEKLLHPLFFEEAGKIASSPHSITAQRVIQNLGHAIEQGDLGKERKARQMLEERYLPKRAEYEIVRVRYNPLRRARGGEVDSQVSLGFYQKGESR